MIVVFSFTYPGNPYEVEDKDISLFIEYESVEQYYLDLTQAIQESKAGIPEWLFPRVVMLDNNFFDVEVNSLIDKDTNKELFKIQTVDEYVAEKSSEVFPCKPWAKDRTNETKLYQENQEKLNKRLIDEENSRNKVKKSKK